MKKIIPFSKDIKFNTKIYEVTSISLEHNLNIGSDNVISGEFIISGDYKINDSSVNVEPFIYGLPFDIALDTKYDTDKINIDIDDFKFEIINEEKLRVNIDVLVEGIEVVTIEEDEIKPDSIIEEKLDSMQEIIEDNSDIESDNSELLRDDKEDNLMNNENDLFKDEEPINKVFSEEDNMKSIFDNFSDKDEKYVSYYVHIVRENDNIDTISMKYGVSIDDLKEYNNIDQITLGNKVIIPYISNDETI